MFRRLALVSSLLLVLNTAAQAQSSGAVVINTDMRLFTAMVALNGAGFDVELGSQYHPVRVAARNIAQKLDPDLLSRLKQFYTEHKRNESDDAQFAKYVSLAVMATPPPELKLPTRDEVLPPDARQVKGFVDLMREVYSKANLAAAFEAVLPQYDEEMTRLVGPIRDQMVKTDAYLRIPSGGRSVRSLEILVELAAPMNSINVRSDQDNYFVILGQSTTPHLEEIRHAYLHFQLDPLVTQNMGKVANGGTLLTLAKDVEGVDRTYVNDLRSMMVESLIRAIEIRMERVMAARAKDMVNSYYRSGLLLAPYFYAELEDYEAQEAGLRDVFPDMATAIHVSDEQARFTASFMSIPIPQRSARPAEVPAPEPPPPPPNPVHELLKEGEAALNSNNAGKAKAVFQTVLSDYDRNNGAALYGLALIASREGNSDVARDFFERTTRIGNVEPSMKVWAYIYLARIFDLQCERDRAIEYYQQAIKLGDDTRKAQTIAKEGIKKPYGDGC
jgi:tetratricopeptide (TPR) repeat protein